MFGASASCEYMTASATTVLVTGGSGFVGGNLAIALAGRGFRVRAFYRKGDDTRLLNDAPVERIEGDICDQNLLEEAASGCDAVFHTAGNVSFRKADRDVQYRVNVEGTRTVLRACRRAGVRRLVHTSTINTLGIPKRGGSPAGENTPFDWAESAFTYAHTKKIAEDIAMSANGPLLEVVVVNPGTVFGPGDLNVNAGSYILAIAKAPVLFYPEGGTNCVHIDVVVAGHIAAYEKGRPGHRYILGGENLTYREMFSTIAGLLGKPAPWLRLPTSLSVISAGLIETFSPKLSEKTRISSSAARAGRINFFYSSDKARQELGLEHIPFRLAVEDAVAWYRKEGFL